MTDDARPPREEGPAPVPRAPRGPASPGAPERRRGTRTERPRRRVGPGLALVGAVPAAAVVWFLLQPADRRRQILESVPAGAGGRALSAAAAFGVLLVLARIALPAVHAATRALAGLLARLRARRGVMRVLLFPVEAVLGILWFAAQALFAVDAALVVGAALLFVLLAARVVWPGLLPGFLPELAR